MHPQITVAGYICLDVIPTFDDEKKMLDPLFQPGKLVTVGTAVTAPGGAVSNTGLALHRLGIPVKLVGKVGNDLFGQELFKQYGQYHKNFAAGLIISPEEATSYTIVISPPGVDRFFLHCTGANNTFCANDVDSKTLTGAQIFHFGYPPLMRSMYQDEGAELALLLQRAKAAGLTTSLDMAIPDPCSEAAGVDWRTLLRRVLPYVDIFLPSFEEVLFMLGDPHNKTVTQQGEDGHRAGGEYLNQAAEQLLDMGAAVVVIKLGDQGLYMRTTAVAERLAAMGAAAPHETSQWQERELLSPCFQANVVGTTGAGDCTIAGFLAGLLKGLPVEEVLTTATAVGAFNVEGPDATSSIPDWDAVQTRIQAGWTQHTPAISLAGWQQKNIIWAGPDDQKPQ
jgi:sugar/nucleoside kinase (ribokinase family)